MLRYRPRAAIPLPWDGIGLGGLPLALWFAEIAWAVIEYIHNHPDLRAKTLFATHYHELTDLSERLPAVVNYNVAVEDSGNGEDVIFFLRRIIPGKADRSYGVHVARMAGLPLAAVNRAEEILGDLERSIAAGPRRRGIAYAGCQWVDAAGRAQSAL